MSRAFVYSLVGGDKIQQNLSKYTADLRKQLEAEFEDSGRTIEYKAKEYAQQKVAVQDDKYEVKSFAQQISLKKAGELNYELNSAHPLSAYFEFGTGRTVFQGESWVDADLKKYAQEFFITGKGTIRPAPFLFNNFYEERVKLIERIKKLIGA